MDIKCFCELERVYLAALALQRFSELARFIEQLWVCWESSSKILPQALVWTRLCCLPSPLVSSSSLTFTSLQLRLNHCIPHRTMLHQHIPRNCIFHLLFIIHLICQNLLHHIQHSHLCQLPCRPA